jgi:hypothetical protein
MYGIINMRHVLNNVLVYYEYVFYVLKFITHITIAYISKINCFNSKCFLLTRQKEENGSTLLRWIQSKLTTSCAIVK